MSVLADKLRLLVLAACVALVCAGCIGARPVEQSNTVDDRPTLAFVFDGGERPDAEVSVYIDGIYMGDARDYAQGKRRLKIVSGTHIVRLEYGGELLVERKIYSGSGSSRTLAISLP